MPMSRSSLEKLRTCDGRLQRVVLEVAQHWPCVVLEGHRGKEAQDAAVARGMSKTPWPESEHNELPSRAVDVAPLPLNWKDREAFTHFAGKVLGIAAVLGVPLRWGGDWKRDGTPANDKFYDGPHFELVEP